MHTALVVEEGELRIGKRWKSGLLGDVFSIQICFSAPSFIPKTLINSTVCKGLWGKWPSQAGSLPFWSPCPSGERVLSCWLSKLQCGQCCECAACSKSGTGLVWGRGRPWVWQESRSWLFRWRGQRNRVSSKGKCVLEGEGLSLCAQSSEHFGPYVKISGKTLKI